MVAHGKHAQTSASNMTSTVFSTIASRISASNNSLQAPRTANRHKEISLPVSRPPTARLACTGLVLLAGLLVWILRPHLLPAMSSDEPGRQQNCVCNWKRCKEISSLLDEHDSSYCGLVRVNYSSKPKAMALRAAVEWHLHVPLELRQKKAEYAVARHHWPRKLVLDNYALESSEAKQRYFSTTFNKPTFERYYDHKHIEDCNTFESCLKRANADSKVLSNELLEEWIEKQKGTFVQAPVVSSSEALAHADSFDSDRGKRKAKRELQATVTPSVQKATAPSTPISSKPAWKEMSTRLDESRFNAEAELDMDTSTRLDECRSNAEAELNMDHISCTIEGEICSPGIVPSVASIHSYLQRKYHELSEEEFSGSLKVQESLNILRFVKKDFSPVDLMLELGGDSKYLTVAKRGRVRYHKHQQKK